MTVKPHFLILNLILSVFIAATFAQTCIAQPTVSVRGAITDSSSALAATSPVFSPARVYAATGQLAWILGVADLNGDGIPDIAVANYGGGSDDNGTAGILIGTATGTFRSAVAYSTGGGA